MEFVQISIKFLSFTKKKIFVPLKIKFRNQFYFNKKLSCLPFTVVNSIEKKLKIKLKVKVKVKVKVKLK